MREKMKQKGITLIALVITIIILIILAGISINMLVGEKGMITKAKQAKENIQIAANEEESQLAKLTNELFGNEVAGKNKNIPNPPKLVEGMHAIKFTNPTETEKGRIVDTNSNDSDWYNYDKKNWANSQTEDGSMWVWIPRYAYRVDKDTQTFDIVFLIGTTDNYYDENGQIQTAKRCNRVDEELDTKTGYTVHPAFTDETAISYRNGGWDKELTGIWVAKFEAGYSSGNNNATVKASSVSYTESISYVGAIEIGQSSNGNESARNWLDGIYGSTKTAIKYPTFQGTTYSMNYINHNDAYNIAKAMTESGNIYGLTESTDSHLMKNSEWGAVAYLSQSKYGLNGTDIAINNISLNSGGTKRTATAGKSGVDSVYAVTGCTTGSISAADEKITTIANINSTTANTAVDGVYTWNQVNGTKASSSGTIYGIYDLSGGTWERMAAYVANGNENLKTYGSSIAYEGSTLKTTSTKYTTTYPFDGTTDNTGIANNDTNLNTASANNYKKNILIYGDGIRETSETGIESTSWFGDYSCYTSLAGSFSFRGGNWWNGSNAGLFCFHCHTGNSNFIHGFRTALVVS